MALKKLGLFVRFDIDAFLNGKTLVVTGRRDWTDYDTKAHLGVAYEVAIVNDATPYNTPNGEEVSNRFEKLTIKVKADNLPVKVNDVVKPVNAVATVYGQYRNQLSIKAESLEVVPQNGRRA